MAPAAQLLRQLLRGALAFVPAAAMVAACDNGTSTAPSESASDGDASTGDASREASTSPDGGGEDASPQTTCAITRAYAEACVGTDDLNCGAEGFDSWCAANDDAINSEAYRRAEELCLTADNCDGKKRRDCEYRHYNEESPTASQQAVVAAYCEMCEPSDVAGCTTRSTTYDAAKGIDSVGDIFVAAWELSDDLVDEITTKCTGSSVDAGASCANAFAECAAEVYLARVPDCPK